MNNFTKTLLTACGVAVASSVITVGAFKASDSGLSRQADTDLSDNGRTDANGRFLTVAQSAALETDFTAAAESTINGVVSIKSYVTLRQRSTRQSTPFDDPFFEFFFGSLVARIFVRVVFDCEFAIRFLNFVVGSVFGNS